MSERRDIESASGPSPARGFGRNVIAVIGIDRYHHWRQLSNAVRDATGAAALFGEFGFDQVTAPLLDESATGKAIQALVTDDLMTLGPDDSLVLFYAGHGGTRKHRLGDHVIKTGYLIPVDASDSQDKASTWVDLEAWLRAVSLLPAKHILVVLDACHSGIALDPILKWRDIGSWQDVPLATLKARRSRRIITSALDDQVALDSGPVYGHSLFTGCLIEGLRHGIRGRGSRVTTGSELGLYVQRRVETYPHSRQTPDFGTFDFDDRGEMVIPLVIERPKDSAAIPEWPPNGVRHGDMAELPFDTEPVAILKSSPNGLRRDDTPGSSFDTEPAAILKSSPNGLRRDDTSGSSFDTEPAVILKLSPDGLRRDHGSGLSFDTEPVCEMPMTAVASKPEPADKPVAEKPVVTPVPWWIWVGGATVAIVIGVGAAISYAERSKETAAAPRATAIVQPAEPAAQPIEAPTAQANNPPVARGTVVELRFASLPSGGVYAPGRWTEECRTPCAFTIDLADGGPTDRREFVVRRDGYVDHPITVDLTGDQREFHVTLEQVVPAAPPAPRGPQKTHQKT